MRTILRIESDHMKNFSTSGNYHLVPNFPQNDQNLIPFVVNAGAHYCSICSARFRHHSISDLYKISISLIYKPGEMSKND